MPLIKYNQISTLTQLKKGTGHLSSVFFLYGDSYLKRDTSNQIIKFLQTINHNDISMEIFQGDEINISSIIESLTTFSFLFPKKLIVIKDLPLTEAGKKGTGLTNEAIESFTQCIKTGFPENHFLVITTASVDKRKAFYKTIESKAMVVDCTIPEGARYADIQEKTGIFKSVIQQKLSRVSKTLQEDAFLLIIEQIGFDLDSVLENIEKLISFSGDAMTIDIHHVRSIVTRTKKDPVFDFTNAMMDRNPADSLLLCDSLMQNRFHPLQILSALTNQFRKILLVKCFIESHKQNNIWQKKMNFNQFKQTTLPVVVVFDSNNRKQCDIQDTCCGSKKGTTSDLVIAPQIQNAYPVFQAFLKSENFSLIELICAYTFLNQLDFKFKSEPIDQGEALKHFIIQTCIKEN